MVLCIQFWVKDGFQSRCDCFAKKKIYFSQNFGMVKFWKFWFRMKV